MNNISFLGLGVMGYPMAGHLQKKSGLNVSVYNRTASKATKWVSEFGGRAASSPSKAAGDADLILLCVGNDDDLRAVLTGEDGVIHSVKEGAIIIDHTTVSAQIAREMADIFAKKKVSFIDAPVSGGQAGAENGALTVMAGGPEDKYALIEPILKNAYAKEMRLMGDVGAGQLTKMVNQICIAGVLQGLSEGLAFGMDAGFDMDELIAVISKGAAQSWQMDNRAKTMVRGEFDFGFAVDWMVKDLQIAIDEGLKNSSRLDVTNEILEFYKELQGKDCGRLDTSALIKRLRS